MAETLGLRLRFATVRYVWKLSFEALPKLCLHTHFTFVPWPIDRTAAPCRFSRHDRVADRSALLLQPLSGGKIAWIRTCAKSPRTPPTLSLEMIISNLREVATLRTRKNSRIEHFLSPLFICVIFSLLPYFFLSFSVNCVLIIFFISYRGYRSFILFSVLLLLQCAL